MNINFDMPEWLAYALLGLLCLVAYSVIGGVTAAFHMCFIDMRRHRDDDISIFVIIGAFWFLYVPIAVAVIPGYLIFHWLTD